MDNYGWFLHPDTSNKVLSFLLYMDNPDWPKGVRGNGTQLWEFGKENNDFDIWDSFYNNTWRTFIRLYPETKLKEDCSTYEEYDEGYHEEDYEDGLELTMREAYEYDGPTDGFDDWLIGNGY